MNTNGVKFVGTDIENAKGVGSIPKLKFEDNITVDPFANGSPMAPRTAFSVARHAAARLHVAA